MLMETMNSSQPTTIETLYPPKKLAQDNTKFQLKNQVRLADTNLISSLTRHQVVPPIIYERSSEYQSELSHLGISDRSKESERKSEVLVPNDSFYFTHNLKYHATPIHLQRRTPIHCWNEKIEKSKDQPILIGISIPVKRTDQEILSPQTALSSSVESPVMNTKNNAHYRYPRCQNNDVAGSTSNTQDRETSKLHQVEEISKISQNFSLSNSSDSSVWIDDFLPGSTRSRTTSFCTTFEEDESPILSRIPESIESSRNLVNQQLRVDTIAAQRCSRGWWNYIISPFLSTSTPLPSSGQEYEERSYSDLAMINHEKLTEIKKENQTQKFKLTTSSKSLENNNSFLELYLKNTEVKSVTSNTPLIKRAMSGLRTTPIEASIHASSELDLSYTRNDLSCDCKDGPSNDKPLNQAEKKPSCQSEYSDNITEISFHLNMPQNRSKEKNVTVLRKSPNKANLSVGIFQKSKSHFSPALYVPPVNILPTRKKSSSPTRKYSQSPMSQKSSFKNKIPNLQTSTMSSRSGTLVSEVVLSPPIRDTTNHTSSHLEIPAISNGGNYPDKYLKDITSDKEKFSQSDFNHHSSRHAEFRGVSIIKSCLHDRAENQERRKRQKQYFVLALFILFMIVTTLLATMTHVRPKRSNIQSQWLNLTEFPPIFLGSSTVISPVLIRENSACVTPATQWSCHLPKELQSSIKDIPITQPNFFIKIDWDNSTEANTTFLIPSNNRTNVGQTHAHKAAIRQLPRYSMSSNSQIDNFKPDPAPPLTAEQWFLGSTTDGIVSADKAGEPTPFYISFIESARPTIEKFKVSSIKNQFPNVSSIIPPPNLGPDGKAAPANLLPYVTNQPIKLYDRGLPTEHFGFYNYFDRSIFLKSIFLDVNDIRSSLTPEDLNGGAARTEASHRCTWSQTRLLVQIWTRKNSTSRVNHKCNQEKVSDINKVLQQPGSFPYPISITLDRHGGDPVTKTLYCYKIDSVGGLDANSGHINIEFRGSGGMLINPAPTIFTNISDSNMGGYDGGNSGCLCQWSNFQENIV